MLPNKFDQYFRDKLLDHSTRPSAGAWKLIHAGLLRHKALHFWKWWVAGPSIVVVAVTGYVVLAQINKPGRAHASTSTHAPLQPATPQTRNAALSNTTNSSDATTLADTTRSNATTRSNTTTPGDPTVSGDPTARGTAAVPGNASSPASTPAARTPNSPNTLAAGAASANTPTPYKISTTGAYTRQPANSHTLTGHHKPHTAQSRPHTGDLTSTRPDTKDAGPPQDQNETPSPGPSSRQRPAGLTAPLKIIHPSIRMAVTAKTPNPGSSKNLIVPAHPYHYTSPWRFDGFGSPEYFTFKGFGFSYGAGARATLILKKHFTITTGIQYLKVDVTARSKYDSLNQLFPGYFNNIQLPVFFGYTIGNDRFSFTANAGMIFSAYADAHGRLKDEGWPNRNGPSTYLGFNFATRVNDHISIFAEPYFKTWYPQRFQNLPAQLYSTGISLGLRFNLK